MRAPSFSSPFSFNTYSENRRFGRGRRRGQALVEMAMAILILIPILIGILEFGILARNNLLIANASREGVRAASLGKTSSATQNRITTAMRPLTTTFGTTSGTTKLEYSTNADTASTPTWQAWPADSGTYNGVPIGAMVRITVATRHVSLTRFFAFLRDRDISQSTVMKREANG